MPTASRYPTAEMLAALAALQPEAIALQAAAGGISYRAMEVACGQLASALRTAGVRRGDVVAVCLPRSADQVIALAATWRCGAAYLPLDPEWPEGRLAALLARADARLVIAPASAAGRFAGTTPVIDPVAAVGNDAASAPTPFEEAGLEDLAYVIFTSGSTGEPKAVEVTHGNLAALVEWHVKAFALQPGIRSSHLAGLAFDAAAWEIWPVLASGGTLVLPPEEVLRYDATALAAWLVAERIEVAFAPTVIAEQLIACPWPTDTALRVLLTGADRLKLRPPENLPFALVNNYGPTECTVVATSGTVSAKGSGLPSIGRPIDGTTIHILDAAGEPVAAGAPGEIWIGGAQVARGYRGDPALTAARFVSQPRRGRLYRTGDLASWGEDGEIRFLGRADAQLKLRGHRIEPGEVEAALCRIDGIAAAAVGMHGDELAAWVVPVPGAALIASRIRAQLGEELPAPMLPSRFAAVTSLPLNASGKLDRAALPDPAASPLPETAGARAPATPTEARLTAIIAEVIGRSDIGVDDDFFLLGGHSLLGTQVIVKARAAFGVELTLLHLFEARTVAALGARIEELALAHLESLSDDDVARMLAQGMHD